MPLNQIPSRRFCLAAGGKLFSYIALVAATSAVCALPAIAQTASSRDPQALILQGQTSLHDNHPGDALTAFQAALTLAPDSAAANLLAASAAVQLFQPQLAVKYGERAKALEPLNWKIDTTLVTAYAMVGDTSHRDAERNALRTAHANPKLTEAVQTKGFLLDLFRAGAYRVEAVEYFKPIGTFNTYFRFVLRDEKTNQVVWTIEANSDSMNQTSWAQAYPKQAAQGQRQFQLDGVFDGGHTEYRTFSGGADYDWIKSQVIKIIAAQKGPFSLDAAPQ